MPPSTFETAATGASSELVQTQHALLLEHIIPTNAEARYGRQYGFETIQSIDDFRARLPLITFENIRTEIDEMLAGEKNVLTTERVLAFFKTSGSMSEPKHIPVTPSLMRQKISAFGQFWEQVYADYPALRSGKIVSNFSDSGGVERLPSGLEVCSEASFWGRRGHSMHERSRWPLPKETRNIEDSEFRTYATARLLIQGELHGIMCLNPSTLLQLCRSIEVNISPLLEGLESGDWGRTESSFAAAIPSSLDSHLLADADRATQLAAQLKQNTPLSLKKIWPTLELAICWSSKIVAPYFKQLQPYLHGVAVRDYISQSSECMMAIPNEDFGSGGQLAYQSHFYEFIPEQRCSDAQPDTLLAWQIEVGSRYELVATTGGGLYRYRTGDCVQVHRFVDGVPYIEFLHRLGKNSSITGEKLTELQVMEAARRTSLLVEDQPREFLCYPCSGETPHYSILFDTGEPETSKSNPATNIRVQRWALEFDSHLAQINSEYADKCRSGRLGPIQGIAVPSGTLALLRQRRKKSGVSDEQVKEEVLVSRMDVHTELNADLASR